MSTYPKETYAEVRIAKATGSEWEGQPVAKMKPNTFGGRRWFVSGKDLPGSEHGIAQQSV